MQENAKLRSCVFGIKGHKEAIKPEIKCPLTESNKVLKVFVGAMVSHEATKQDFYDKETTDEQGRATSLYSKPST